MIRALFALLVIFGGLFLGGLWLTRDLELEGMPTARPRLHTVDLNDLVDSALEAARRQGVPAPETSPPREERLPAPAPFVEAPAPDEVEPARPAPTTEPGSLAVAARDQDAWAALIRRMLALQRRAGTR